MSGPRRFGEEAHAFVAKTAAADSVIAASVMEAWGEVAGPEIGRHTESARFRKGELLVSVDTAAWANELQLMGEQLRVRLNERIGKETVTSVRFTVSKRVGERNRRHVVEAQTDRLYATRELEARALSSEERDAVSRAAEQVPDAEVRDALRRAMETSMRIRGGGGKTPR